MFVECQLFGQLLSNELRPVWDCYFARLEIEKETKLLEKLTIEQMIEERAK